MKRKLTYNIFQKVYPRYLKYKEGQNASKKVIAVTHDQVYFFSLTKHLFNESNYKMPVFMVRYRNMH